MKDTYIILLLALALFPCVLKAQTEAGRFLLGGTTQISPGSVGFGFSKSTADNLGTSTKTTNKNTNFNVSPALGYFVVNGLATGLAVGLGWSNYDTDFSKYKSNSFSISPYVRYYVPLEAKVKPYVDLRGNFIHLSSKYTSNFGPPSENDRNYAGFGAGLGGAFFIGAKTSLDLFMDYSRLSSKHESTDLGITNKIKETSANIGFGIGFTFFL